jgi:hypothetical protein
MLPYLLHKCMLINLLRYKIVAPDPVIFSDSLHIQVPTVGQQKWRRAPPTLKSQSITILLKMQIIQPNQIQFKNELNH